MFDLFLAALGMSYLQHGGPPCKHTQLYPDTIAKVIRCRGCRTYWELPDGLSEIPEDWERRVRRSIIQEAVDKAWTTFIASFVDRQT